MVFLLIMFEDMFRAYNPMGTIMLPLVEFYHHFAIQININFVASIVSPL